MVLFDVLENPNFAPGVGNAVSPFFEMAPIKYRFEVLFRIPKFHIFISGQRDTGPGI